METGGIQKHHNVIMALWVILVVILFLTPFIKCSSTVKQVEQKHTDIAVVVKFTRKDPETNKVHTRVDTMPERDWKIFRLQCDTTYVTGECKRKNMFGYGYMRTTCERIE